MILRFDGDFKNSVCFWKSLAHTDHLNWAYPGNVDVDVT